MSIKSNGAKEVYLVYPFAGKDKFPITVYPFNEQVIKTVVPESVECGNYRIGEVNESNEFSVFYVGRATKEKLKDRLADHIEKFGKRESVYFSFESKPSEKEAYIQECTDYHNALDVDGYFRNKNHPSKPSGYDRCPICGI